MIGFCPKWREADFMSHMLQIASKYHQRLTRSVEVSAGPQRALDFLIFQHFRTLIGVRSFPFPSARCRTAGRGVREALLEFQHPRPCFHFHSRPTNVRRNKGAFSKLRCADGPVTSDGERPSRGRQAFARRLLPMSHRSSCRVRPGQGRSAPR